jgi:hypothetical protein
MENITWYPIERFEGLYSINKNGDVLSLRAGNILAQSFNTYGYKQVGLFKNRASRVAPIHRLMAETFIPNPNNYDCVNHKDGNKLNNSIENLEWCTKAQNNQHARESGLHRGGGMKKPVLKLRDGEVISEYPSVVEASKDGYSINAIYSCVSGYQIQHAGFNWKYKEAG